MPFLDIRRRNRPFSTCHLWFPISVPWASISYRFRDKRRFLSRKS